MITKEKEKKVLDKIIIEEENQDKYNKKPRILIWLIILIFILLSLIVTYILNAFNMVIYNPFETRIISVSSEGKEWYKDENINLFQKMNKDGEKLIWSGQSGEYNFVVKNDSNQPTYYKFYMEDTNEFNINIKYRLKMNNTYIIR